MPLILGTFVCGYIMVALGSLQIEDSGVLPIHRGDILMLFYLTVVNECEDAVQVEARGEHCCDSLFPEDPTACEIMRLTGGHMGLFDPRERRNITLFFVTPRRSTFRSTAIEASIKAKSYDGECRQLEDRGFDPGKWRGISLMQGAKDRARFPFPFFPLLGESE
ncbi:Uncharacterized protein GBIM_19304 [Gryllus bimaculatus]|nr:Uncharacterized protein GBIM_19304 [Gryllus bimaculatus]